MVPKYPRIFRNRFRFILVPKYSTTPALSGGKLDRCASGIGLHRKLVKKTL